MFTIKIVIFHYQTALEALQLSTLAYNFNYCHTFLSYMTRAWGMPTSFVYNFYFPLPRERFGSHRFPSPSNGSFLQFLSSLFLTMVLSVEETLMYFGYTYAPNLTHQGASVILKFHPQMVTGIPHLQTPISSPAAPRNHFQEEKTIQLVKKLTCAKTLKEARARA
jgi:hypothetical protein